MLDELNTLTPIVTELPEPSVQMLYCGTETFVGAELCSRLPLINTLLLAALSVISATADIDDPA